MRSLGCSRMRFRRVLAAVRGARAMRRALEAIALLAAIVFVAGEGYRRWQGRGVVESRATVGATPYVSLVPEAPRTRGTAILVHGARCGVAMMLPLGRMLARNGVAVVIPDLPGHGASPASIQAVCDSPAATLAECAPRFPIPGVLERALRDLRGVPRVADGPVVLIGHSWGGRLVDALGAAAGGARVVGRISLEGGAGPTQQTNNELYVAGAWYQQRGVSPPGSGLAGHFEDLTAFRYLETGKRHLALIRDAGVNASILDWVERTLGEPLGRDTRPLYALPVALSVALLILVAAVFLLAAPGPGGSTQLSLARGSRWVSGVTLLSSMVACLLVAWHLVHSSPLVKALHSTGWLVLPYLQMVGLLATPVCLALPGLVRSLSPRSVAKEVGLALALFGAIALVVFAYVSSTFLHLWVPPQRLPRFLLMALLSLPVALVVRLLPMAISGRRPVQLAGTLATWGLLFAGWLTLGGLDRLELAEVCVSVSLLESFASVFRRRPVFSAVLVSCSLAWAFTSLHPVVSGLDFPAPRGARLQE